MKRSHWFSVNGSDVQTTDTASRDGRTCYEVVTRQSANQSTTVTISDGAGKQLAQGTADGNGKVFVECDGTTYPFPDSCMYDDLPECASGYCP